MRQFFSNFIEESLSAPTSNKTLPLTHGARSITLRDILSDGVIELPKQDCEVLGGKYVFTFYGRPAYRPKYPEGGMRRPTSAPTYVVFKSSLLASAAKAHALDTGAFDSEVYRQHIDRALNAVDFGFPAEEDYLNRLVSYFFESNENYLNNSPKTGLNVPVGEEEAESYYSLLISNAVEGDDRDTAVEIIFDAEVPITKETVECIVMPDILDPSQNYGEKCRELGIPTLTYRFRRGFRPGEYQSSISDALYEYYSRNSLI